MLVANLAAEEAASRAALEALKGGAGVAGAREAARGAMELQRDLQVPRDC